MDISVLTCTSHQPHLLRDFLFSFHFYQSLHTHAVLCIYVDLRLLGDVCSIHQIDYSINI